MNKPTLFIIDVDGILTDGGFYYSSEGKVMKKFGPDDNDALGLIKPYIKILFVSADKRGFEITKKRIQDMNMQVELVSVTKRTEWIKENFASDNIIYMGDGIFDHYVMKEVLYSIATVDSDDNAIKQANYVTKRCGGHRALAEACLHILEKFFVPYNPEAKLTV